MNEQWRMFGLSSWLNMPRGVGRFNKRNILEDDTESSEFIEHESEHNNQWEKFVNQKKLSDDNRISSHFGNIRFDKDNAPRLMNLSDKTWEEMEEQKIEELEKDRDVQPKSHIITRNITPEQFSSAESMFFEEDDLPIKKEANNPEEKPIKQSKKDKIYMKSKDNKKNVEEVQLNEKYSKTNESDLNYFDELAFGDKYRNFDPAKLNTNHQVLPGPLSGKIKASMEDLNFVDEQYLGSSREMFSSSDIDDNIKQSTGLNSTEEKEQDIQESHDQSFIDEQYFTPTKYIPQKDVKQEIDSQEAGKRRIDGKEERKEIKAKNKKESKVAESSAALTYVRSLRKVNEMEDEVTLRKDPASEIGKNIRTRLADASFPLVTKVNRKKDVEEEEMNTEVNIYKSIDTYSPPDLTKYISSEVENLLSTKILYNDNEVIGVWKPYGLPMFGSGSRPDEHSLEKYLPFLANELGYKQLYEVHRLDATTTGVVLLATSEARRKHLKQLFAARKIVKTYFAITNGVPSPNEGIISIPIGEGKIGDRYRPTLRPDYSNKDNKIITNKKTSKSSSSHAGTEYKVLGSNRNASLVEILMISGVKHQIRVHLGLGLGTPILGDNKYSHIDQIGPPQRVIGSIVSRLGLKRSQTRNLPIFLHSKRVSIPDILHDKTLTIMASKPHFFTKVQRRLNLREP